MSPGRALLFVLVLMGACAAPAPKGRGGKCHSLSDCKPGLACIEGVCSTDLSPVEGEVPDYGEPDAGVPAAAEAGPAGDAGG
jgi:hypothetical protein